MKKAERASGIEIIRIIAMLMILFSHYTIHSGFNLFSFPMPEIGGVNYYNRLLLYSLKYGAFGVNVFIVISGYFGIRSTFRPQKIVQLWLQVFLYSIVIYGLCVWLGIAELNILTSVKNLCPILFKQYWFITAYIVMYLLSPYWNKLLLSLERKQLLKLTVTMLILWCVIPTFTTMDMYGGVIPQFLLMYTAGAYLSLYPDNILAKKHFASWGLLASLLLLFASSLTLALMEKVSLFFPQHYYYFYDSNMILTFVGAVCLVWIGANMKIGSVAWINRLGGATFGVFLIHAHPCIRYKVWTDLLKAKSFETSPWLILHLIGCVILVYIICTIIEILRQTLLERYYMPYINSFFIHKNKGVN